MSRILRLVSVQSVPQLLVSPLIAVLRTHPPDCHHEEGNALRACQIRSGEGEKATGLPGADSAARAPFMRTSGIR